MSSSLVVPTRLEPPPPITILPTLPTQQPTSQQHTQQQRNRNTTAEQISHTNIDTHAITTTTQSNTTARDDENAAAPAPGTGAPSTGPSAATSGADAPGVAPKKKQISYTADRVIGTGSFGVVYQAVVVETGETVAIKKVLQDRRFKNRELQIMSILTHPNVIRLRHCFYSHGDKASKHADELYLNLCMDFIPSTSQMPKTDMHGGTMEPWKS